MLRKEGSKEENHLLFYKTIVRLGGMMSGR